MTTPRERSVFSQIFSFQHVYSFEYPLRYFWKRLIVFPWIVRKNQKLSHGKRPTNIFMIPRFRKLATPLPFFFKKMKIKLCLAGDSLNNSYSSSSVFSRVSPRFKASKKRRLLLRIIDSNLLEFIFTFFLSDFFFFISFEVTFNLLMKHVVFSLSFFFFETRFRSLVITLSQFSFNALNN